MVGTLKSTVLPLCIMFIAFHSSGGEYLQNMHGVPGPCQQEGCDYHFGCERERGYCICDQSLWGPNCDKECACPDQVCDGDDGSCCFYNFSSAACAHRYGHCHPINTEVARYGLCHCKFGFYGKNCSISCGCDPSNTNYYDGQPICRNGVCQCNGRAYGKRCQYRCNCPNNGKCDRNGFCRCTTKSYGKFCDKPCNCHANNSKSASCHWNGGYGQCSCKSGYRGLKCDEENTGQVVSDIYTTEETYIDTWIVTFIDPTAPNDKYCMGIILNKFFIVTTPKCFTTVEQAQNLEIFTRDNVTYAIERMIVQRDAIGDVFGPILLKIDQTLHPSGLIFNDNTALIGLINETLMHDRNPGMSVGLKYKGSKKIQTGNFTHISDTDCLNEYYMNEDENIFCAKADNDSRVIGCLLGKGSPFTRSYGGEGIPYLAGLKYSGLDRECQFDRVYHYLKISSHYEWIMDMINPSQETS